MDMKKLGALLLVFISTTLYANMRRDNVVLASGEILYGTIKLIGFESLKLTPESGKVMKLKPEDVKSFRMGWRQYVPILVFDGEAKLEFAAIEQTGEITVYSQRVKAGSTTHFSYNSGVGAPSISTQAMPADEDGMVVANYFLKRTADSSARPLQNILRSGVLAAKGEARKMLSDLMAGDELAMKEIDELHNFGTKEIDHVIFNYNGRHYRKE